MRQQLNQAELRQLETFNKLADTYASHYEDRYSQLYRNHFLYDPLFRAFDHRGRHLLEAMCGPGSATGYLLERGAKVTGLDISSDFTRLFGQRWPTCQAICASARSIPVADGSFDGVVIIGGLHHTHPDLDEVVAEIHRVLKPGGSFFFIEPHAGSYLDHLRALWYRFDPLFAANEAAIDLHELETKHSHRFTPVHTSYAGGLAYFLVLQSMIFRVPYWLKAVYSSPLMSLERRLQRWQTHSSAMSAITLCEWKRKS